MKKQLALFDFDGTLTTRDTFIEFIKYYVGWPRFILGFAYCMPVLILYKAKIIANWKAKEFVLTHFFGNESVEDLNRKGEDFCNKVVPGLIKPHALKKLQWHLDEGHEVYLVSASAENWVSCWCKNQKIECIATKLEVLDGKITGKIKGKNCYGPEKVNRVKQKVDLSKYDKVYAYGDSRGDREMLALAGHRFYRHF